MHFLLQFENPSHFRPAIRWQHAMKKGQLVAACATASQRRELVTAWLQRCRIRPICLRCLPRPTQRTNPARAQ
jgi:hypothetical protein